MTADQEISGTTDFQNTKHSAFCWTTNARLHTQPGQNAEVKITQ
ncbi:hypothetical protein [Shouchella clausii]|nr:hypothetical protein [Shouchella clausii]